MEKKSFSPETPIDASETKTEHKRRTVPEVLRDWFYYREFGSTPRAEAEDDEESDESDSTKKKKNRFTRFFTKLFGREVGQGQPEENAQPDTEKREDLLLNNFISLEKVAEDKATNTEEADTEVAKNLEDTTETTGTVAAPAETKPMSAPEIDLPSPETEERLDALALEPPEVPPPLMTPEEVLISLRTEQEQAPEIVAPPKVDVLEKERVIEKNAGAALAAFAGAELLSRRRDKRQQKEIDTTKQELETLQKKQEAARFELHKRTQAEVQSPQLERATPPPPVEQRIENRPAPDAPIVKPEREAMPAPQSVKEILQNRVTEQPIIEKVQAKKDAEKLTHTPYEELRPELIRQQVEKAAEKNVAIEGMFERRHESKDNDKQTYATQQMGFGVGVNPSQFSQQSTVSPLYDSHAMSDPKAQAASQREQYKKAAQNGFWAAMVLLVFIGVLFLVT